MSRVALVTGASKGLGKTLSEFLALQGYDLVITARGDEALQAVAEQLRQHGTNVTAIAGDVANGQHRTHLVEAVRGFGQLDLLVNNASILGALPLPELVEYPLDALADTFNVNVIAPIALIQATLPFLKASRGLVVNISSDAAVGGYENWGGYGASKAALDLMSKTLAEELRRVRVGVVSVDPGDMRTEMHQAAFVGEDISDRPLPDVTIPFWAWLLGQDRLAITGQRFQAQAELWEVVT